MTSTLGAAFGIAVVTTIYTALSVNHQHNLQLQSHLSWGQV